MHISLEVLTELIILITALSLDTFAACFSFGLSSIVLPWSSRIVLAAISSLTLALSASFGVLIKTYINSDYIKAICFLMLIIPGFVKLFDSFIKSTIRRKQGIDEQICFTLFNLNFILHIYANPDIADCDNSKTLSVKEAIPVSIALSLDSLAVGIGAALNTFHFEYTIIASFIVGIISIVLGYRAGKNTSKKIKYDLSWISGIMLIILAVLKLF